MKALFFTIFLLMICFEKGLGILCYHCHQTSKECNNGIASAIHQKNCSEDRCAVMKYETIMPGKRVLATLRDCASHSEHEFVNKVSPDIRNPAKIILFQECTTHLCNTSSTKIVSRILIILICHFLLR